MFCSLRNFMVLPLADGAVGVWDGSAEQFRLGAAFLPGSSGLLSRSSGRVVSLRMDITFNVVCPCEGQFVVTYGMVGESVVATDTDVSSSEDLYTARCGCSVAQRGGCFGFNFCTSLLSAFLSR